MFNKNDDGDGEEKKKNDEAITPETMEISPSKTWTTTKN